MRNHHKDSATLSLTSAEDDMLQHKENRLRVEVFPGAACIDPLTGSDSSFISGRCSSPHKNLSGIFPHSFI